MKRIFTLLSSIFIITSIFAQTNVDVVTGENYADEVYYSFDNDILKTAPRNTWDIAFNTNQMSVSVLANNGAGMMVYTWNNGTIDDWETADTTGMAWKPLYNSLEDWEYGAFNDNTDTSSVFDYGWGIYNIASHNVTGDSIFILQLSDGSYKKFAIEQKNAIQNVWTFKYANLDGTSDTTIVLDTDDYDAESFVHFSITNDMVVEQQPSERWQLLFTRYYDYNIPYYVTGVLTNAGVRVQQVNGVSQADYTAYSTSMMNDTISEIGSDWKSFNMGSFQYEVADDVVYFVQDTAGTDNSVWKLYFTGFGGSTDGTYSFVKTKMNPTAVNDISDKSLVVYPNPAKNELNIIHDFYGATDISIYNISGQRVLNRQVKEKAGLNKQTLNISSLPSGIYNAKVSSGNSSRSVKFVKE